MFIRKAFAAKQFEQLDGSDAEVPGDFIVAFIAFCPAENTDILLLKGFSNVFPSFIFVPNAIHFYTSKNVG